MNNLTPVCTAGQQFYGLHDRSRLLSTSSVRGISVRSGHLTKLSVVVVNLASSVFSRPLCTSQRRQRPLPHARARRRGAPPHRRSTATIHPSSPMGVRARPPSLPRPSVRPRASRIVMNQFRQPKTQPDYALSMRICTIHCPTPSRRARFKFHMYHRHKEYIKGIRVKFEKNTKGRDYVKFV